MPSRLVIGKFVQAKNDMTIGAKICAKSGAKIGAKINAKIGVIFRR